MDVILNGGEAVVRDPTTAESVDDEDRTTRNACSGEEPFGSITADSVHTVPRAAGAVLRMTS